MFSPRRTRRHTPSKAPERQFRRPVEVTIRRAFPDDAPALRGLAALDGASPPVGDVLVAEVAGEPWAALALDGDRVIADPFRPTAELVTLLRTRAEQLQAAAPARTPALRRLVPLLR